MYKDKSTKDGISHIYIYMFISTNETGVCIEPNQRWTHPQEANHLLLRKKEQSIELVGSQIKNPHNKRSSYAYAYIWLMLSSVNESSSVN